MKYFFALSFILIAGCSIDPYAPGGKYYVAPGTFSGLWVMTYYRPNMIIADTNHCTAIIMESDESLVGTITNDSTKEVLSLRGTHSTIGTDGQQPLYNYNVTESSSIGDSNTATNFYFYGNGDTMLYYGTRAIPGWPEFEIVCVRKE